MSGFQAFIDAAFTMPTTLFSVALILCGLYWAMVIFGLFDLEIFETLFGLADGAADGVAESLAEGAGDAMGGAADASNGCLRGCLGAFGVGQVPVTIPLTLLTLFAWGFSYGGMGLVKQMAWTVGGLSAAVLVGTVALFLALGVTMVLVTPLKRLNRNQPATTRRELVGRICQIRTLTVSDRFGQALVSDDHGGSNLIQVRSNEPDNGLTRNDQATIFEYDAAREVFLVTPRATEPAPAVAASEDDRTDT